MPERLTLSVRAARVFGAGNLLSAVLVAGGVFGALPSRWWVVDGCAAAVALLLAGSGGGLLARTPWSERVARAASFVSLAVGLVFVATLAITASYLRGVYGPVGRGGAIILVLVLALSLPYLVVLPAVELVWLGPRARSPNASDA